MMIRGIRAWVASLAVLALSACGGGGNPAAPPGEQSLAVPAPVVSSDAIYDVSFLDGQLGWAGGKAGWVQKTADGGATWTRLTPVTGEVVKIAFADADHGWVLTTAGLSGTSDGGKTWQQIHNQGMSDDGSIKLMALDTKRLVLTSHVPSSGRLGSTYSEAATASDDGGATWRLVLGGNSVVVAASGTTWATDLFGSTLRTNYLGLTFTQLSSLPACFAVLQVVDAQNIWAYCGGFRSRGPEVPSPELYTSPMVFHSLDGGQTWVDVKASFPPLPTLSWSLSTVSLNAQGEGWGVLSYGPSEARTTITLRVSNGGRIWTPLVLPTALAGAVPIVDWIVDPNTLWLVLNNQVQWTDDGGATWRVLNMPGTESRTPLRIRRVAQGALLVHFATDSAGQLDTHKQRFYHSTDGGQTWQRVSGGAAS